MKSKRSKCRIVRQGQRKLEPELAVQQLCRKAPEGPGGPQLNVSQPCALALVKANRPLGCVS